MLTYHHRSASLCLISTDLPMVSSFETAATVYQKDQEKFHILLREPKSPQSVVESDIKPENTCKFLGSKTRLVWLEIYPKRVVMTVQSNDKLNYRHCWSLGVHSISRYWLNGKSHPQNKSLHLQNFTKSLTLEGNCFPQNLRIEYQLWSDQVSLGNYVLHLEIIN